ncbi:MAG: PAS domain S-box protein [Syntrophales bacterium]
MSKSEQKYRALLDNAADAVLIAHKDGYIIDTNPKARELLGYSKKEFWGLHFTKLYLPKDSQRAKEAFERIIHQKRSRISDAHVLKKDGQIIDADINGSCFKAGDDILVTGIFRDMTEQKQILDRLKTSQKDLEARIAERTMELMECNITLKFLLSHQEHE